jgi:hypothetical protein
MSMDRSDYEQQPILDALRACASGEFSTWTLEQHQVLADWCVKYPRAIAGAACAFLDEHLPEGVGSRLKLEDYSQPGPGATPFEQWAAKNVPGVSFHRGPR